MTAISGHELSEHIDLLVHKAAEKKPVVVTDQGRSMTRMVPFPVSTEGNPFFNRKLLPGFAKLQSGIYGGTDSTTLL